MVFIHENDVALFEASPMMKPATRREKQRIATTAEIKQVARAQIAKSGAAALSLRAVAAAMGITAPALYRYFPNRDALVTALIVDAFDALGSAIRAAQHAAAGASDSERMFAGLRAYRAWSLAHPAEFALLFGTPIPGYIAPRQMTVPAARRAFAALLEVPLAAAARGELPAAPPDEPAVNPEFPLPGDTYTRLIEGWATVHGLISLELTGHLAPAIGDPHAAYERAIRHLVDAIGLACDSRSPP